MGISKDKIVEVRQILGESSKDIIAHGLGFKQRGGKVKCPAHEDSTPSMAWDKENLRWKCFGCDETIDIYDYLVKYKGMTFPEAFEEASKMAGVDIETTIPNAVISGTEFVLPDISEHKRQLGKMAIEYMEHRKITKETLDFWMVRERTWFGKDVFIFPYFEDMSSKLIYVSYRDIVPAGTNGSKGGCELNTKSILWGMRNCDTSQPLVITEGQIDAMTIWQVGYKNVVSMPGGAGNTRWIDHCWDWIQQFPMIVVFADNDKAGLACANEIQQKLSKKDLPVKIIHSTYKDANEILMENKPDTIIRMINEAVLSLPAGIKDLAMVDYISKKSRRAGIETGFYQIDRHVKDLKTSELSIILGRNNEGKTTFVSQMIAHSLNNDNPVFLYSGEMSDQTIQEWLYFQAVGKQPKYLQTVETKYGLETDIKDYVIRALKKWHVGKLYSYDNCAIGATELPFLFERMELCAKRYGVKLFIIDNLMSALSENASSLNSDQANFVQECKNFSKANDVHVVLVVHPSKGKKELSSSDEGGNLEKSDISGSNNIANKADVIIAVERIWGEDKTYDAVVSVLKDRDSGQRVAIKYMFSSETLRFYNNYTKEVCEYGWIDLMENEYKEIKEPNYIQGSIMCEED